MSLERTSSPGDGQEPFSQLDLSAAVAPAAVAASDGLINILIVDDEPKNLVVLETLLDDPDYRLVRANSADQALLALVTEEFALLILDVQMPGMTGFELAQMIKARKKTAIVPIIFLTAYYNEDQHIIEGYGAGAVDYLHKPVNAGILRSKVAIFAEMHRRSRETAVMNRALRAEVSERRRAEEQLRELTVNLEQRVRERTAALRRREAELQSITDNVPDMIARFDRGYRYVFVNVAVTQVIGLGSDAFLGKTGRDLRMPRALCDKWEDALQDVFSSGRPREIGFSLHSTGGERRYEATLLPESAADGSVEHVLAVTRDVTSAWQAADEIAKARDVAEAASAAKDQFLAILSHELRTPLTPVRMALSMWERHPEGLPPEIRSDLAMIRRNVDLECRLIDDMLDLNRIAHDKLELQFKPVDLHEEINHAVTTIEGEALAKQLQLTVDLGAAQSRVMADATRIQQVLWNLLKNAVKFTPAGGTVLLRTYNCADRVRVEIRDNGVGISPETIGEIFNAFEQGGARVTRQFGGLGLGLAISRALTAAHSGTLTAESEGEGRGATFTLELGVVGLSSTVTLDTVNDAPIRSRSSAMNSKPRLRILLVEDHEDSARLMSRLLRESGYEVHTAHNVAAALLASNETHFDLIISDLGLPDGSGNDLMNHVMATRPVKAIALSGYGMDIDKRRTKESGFAAHLTKPVSFEQLRAAISRLTTEAAGPPY